VTTPWAQDGPAAIDTTANATIDNSERCFITISSRGFGG
jgi:hypothetical protein